MVMTVDYGAVILGVAMIQIPFGFWILLNLKAKTSQSLDHGTVTS